MGIFVQTVCSKGAWYFVENGIFCLFQHLPPVPLQDRNSVQQGLYGFQIGAKYALCGIPDKHNRNIVHADNGGTDYDTSW